MSDPMRKIMKLFLVLSEESKTMEEVGPLADQLFHNECRMLTSEGQILNKPRIMADMEAMVRSRVTMELTKVEQDEFGILYEYNLHKPREHDHKMVAKSMIRDGKIYHVEIADAATVAPEANPKMRRATAPVIHGF